MNNKAKLLLSSLILATSSVASAASAAHPIVMNVEKSIESNGTVNIYPGIAISVLAGKWITNNGVINFYKQNDNDKFDIIGTDPDNNSGIKNNRSTIITQIEGGPTYKGGLKDLSPEQAVFFASAKYYGFKKGTGEMWVIDSSKDFEEIRALSSDEYNEINGGTIIDNDDVASLGTFFDENDMVTSDEKSVILLRGADAMESTNGVVSLVGRKNGKPLEIKAALTNSDNFRTFVKDGKITEYPNAYGLLINGYFNFSGNNTAFSASSVEFAEGESKILTIQSLFPQNEINVSGGNLTLDFYSNEAFNLSNTINVKSHKEEDDKDVYGCLKITSRSNCNLGENGVINLGVIPSSQE